jgi:hypothetical protein
MKTDLFKVLILMENSGIPECCYNFVHEYIRETYGAAFSNVFSLMVDAVDGEFYLRDGITANEALDKITT